MNEYKEHTDEELEAIAAEALKQVQESGTDDLTADQKNVRGRSRRTQDKTRPTPAETGKKRFVTGKTLVQIMNGEILTKELIMNNLPFTFFLSFLFVVMIAWGYYGETVAKKEVQLEKELSELNSEFFTLTAEYNTQRGRRQIADRLNGSGVKESVSSPYKIRVRRYVFN